MTEFAPDRRSLPAITWPSSCSDSRGLFAKWLPLSPPFIVLGRVVFAALALAVFMAREEDLLPGSARKRRPSLRPMRDRPGRPLVRLLRGRPGLAASPSASFPTRPFPRSRSSSSPSFEGNRPMRRTSSSPGLTLVGVFLIVPRFALADPVLLGVLWGLLSGATFAVLADPQPEAGANGIRACASRFIRTCSPVSLLLPVVFGRHPHGSGQGPGLLAVLGVFCTAVAHTLFIRGMRNVNAQTASLIASLEPVYGILLALVFLGEVPTARTVLGGAIILGAVLAGDPEGVWTEDWPEDQRTGGEASPTLISIRSVLEVRKRRILS